ncbi:MAG TPA: pilus assembly protein [Dyella sp.]|nr:pilus assembly protein [Dyella sp.]
MLQAILFYRGKATVDYAAQEAARAGALYGADMGQMQKGFARGLTPLYATAASSRNPLGVYEAFKTAQLQITTMGVGSITVISPTTSAFDDFKEAQYDGTMALPNDSLNFRSNKLGGRSGLSVQDANILKIQVTYKFPLIVPIIDRLIGTLDPARTALEGHTVYSISIVADAMVRMQSPVTNRANLAAR